MPTHYGPLIQNWKRCSLFLAAMLLLLFVACSLAFFKLVCVKMMPFHNKRPRAWPASWPTVR